jgi:Fe-S cluster assembly protein SufB
MRDENQLHAAVVELVALDDAEIKYSTVQNWYPGDANGVGGIYNFVTKRALCQGKNSKVSWTQVETGSAITWKYPSCVLSGENSVGEFYSVALTNNRQQADTGTKMIHLGKGSRSTIVSKGISAGRSDNTYRGLVRVGPTAENVRNYTQCDSLLLGDQCGAHTVPYIEVRNPTAQIEHEATTSKISDDQLFYAMQRGLSQEDAVALIVNGFAKEVLQQLPMEFAVEAQKLLGISLEGSVDDFVDAYGCTASAIPGHRTARCASGIPARDGSSDGDLRELRLGVCEQQASGSWRRSRQGNRGHFGRKCDPLV